jgi:hypothetical protein
VIMWEPESWFLKRWLWLYLLRGVMRSRFFVIVLVCLHKNNGKWNKLNNMPPMSGN